MAGFNIILYQLKQRTRVELLLVWPSSRLDKSGLIPVNLTQTQRKIANPT